MTNTLKYPKPNIVLSKCLGVAACRYNGHIILNKTIDSIKPFMNFIAVCPEEEIGLGTPRDPIRLVDQDGITKLIQPKTGLDVTNDMISYSENQVKEFSSEIDGFILKDRSPSCGINNVNVYSEKHGMVMRKSMGLFAEIIKKFYPESPMENEGRLLNKQLREHFLTSVFTLSRLRAIKDKKQIKELQLFHAQHKYLLMGYNQSMMRDLGKIAANSDKTEFNVVYDNYYKTLLKVFKHVPRKNNMINIFLHNMGYFKEQLKSSEKAMFLELLDKYRKGIVSQGTVNYLLRSWIIRYEEKYLESQYLFAPFPEDLIPLPNSGKN